MNRLRTHRAPRVAGHIASLALFLLGSNYCLLGALRGDTRMACMLAPGAATAAAVPSCHHAAPTPKSSSDRPASRPSCCPNPLVVPATPSLQDESGIPAATAILANVGEPLGVPAPARHGHVTPPDGQPPTRLTHAPAPARAPPLA